MKIGSCLWVFLFFALKTFGTENQPEADERVSFPASSKEWEEQRKFFEENGYLWVKDFFSPEQVLVFQEWAAEMHRAAQNQLDFGISNTPLPLIIVPERSNPSQVCRVEDMLTCYPDFHQFVESSLTPFIGELLGEPHLLFKDKLNFKWPGGGAFLPHQDFPAYEAFAPRLHVTAMICVDSATLQNGCLHVAKHWKETFQGCQGADPASGYSEQLILPYVEGGSAHGSIQQEYVEKISWLPLKTSPRDLVLINSFVPHYSEPNQSNASRRAMFITYNKQVEGESRTAYYQAKRGDPQNPLFHFGTPTHARGK